MSILHLITITIKQSCKNFHPAIWDGPVNAQPANSIKNKISLLILPEKCFWVHFWEGVINFNNLMWEFLFSHDQKQIFGQKPQMNYYQNIELYFIKD